MPVMPELRSTLRTLEIQMDNRHELNVIVNELVSYASTSPLYSSVLV